ncbi:MAG: PhzF family phenazine biosynthesis protein [Thermodesulfobacteriota bacterium]
MELTLYQVDAFADRLFSGNPAAVCPLKAWLPNATLQAIAGENNLSETAFYVPAGEGFQIRWFTPTTEVELCGHATLATAHVIFNHTGYGEDSIRFASRSGDLTVARDNNCLVMDFPSQPATPCGAPDGLVEGLGREPDEVLASADYMVVFGNEEEILALQPDFEGLRSLDLRGVIITAPGREVDFVSRFFAPKFGIDEDPVTGSAHCTLAPYWAARLNKTRMTARQLSKRGGEIVCEVRRGDRVALAGRAVTYLEGTINVPIP